MITIEEAKTAVLAAANAIEHITEAELPEDVIIDTDVAWYIPFRDKQPDGITRAGAYHGFIVGKVDGVLFQPGSGYTIEKWLIGFKLGILHGPYDLEIISIKNYPVAVWQLSCLGMQYFCPEEEGGVVWKIPHAFTKTIIEERLQHLPCFFRQQRFVLSINSFIDIHQKQAFEYRLITVPARPDKMIGEELE